MTVRLEPYRSPMPARPGLPARWEHFDHGSDIGVRGFGPTREAAFEQAALAMTAVIAQPDVIQERDAVSISCEAGDDELLLVAWLNAVVSQMAVRRMLFRRFQVELDGRRLTGLAIGERIAPERHRPAVEVKGATYTSARVARTAAGGWLAQTVVDV